MPELLKFITCGSVDDGKSTLIGHLLYDAKLLFADQRQALILDSKVKLGDGALDYSLLLDGLMAEREQGITIDVAYRYFATGKRRFIIADTPGHEEYTRNMAVGASFADLAVLLIDVTKGITSQTRRHLQICSLMGIRHYVFAVNKMDLAGYDEQAFLRTKEGVTALLEPIEHLSCYTIPVSATAGDHITSSSGNMPWFSGPPLLSYLEDIELHASALRTEQFVMPVQRVCRCSPDFRGFVGTVEEGIIKVGDRVTALPSGEKAKIKEIYVLDKKEAFAGTGAPVTVTLNREIDVSRGCVLKQHADVKLGTLFQAKLLWMDHDSLAIGRSYYLMIGTQKVPAVVTEIISTSLTNDDAVRKGGLRKNEMAECIIRTSSPVAFETGGAKMPLGKFIMVDRTAHSTACCGVITACVDRKNNLYGFENSITKEIRAAALRQKPITLWFTGLSGAGKSTIASELEKALIARGKHTMVLDGDNIRLGINKNLGFSMEDRAENIRTVAEIAKLMNDAGLIVLAALISPFRADRKNAADIIGDAYVEIYVDASLKACEKRDKKGLYKRARSGLIREFTGISSPYEPPIHADIVLNTEDATVQECVKKILEDLTQKGLLSNGDEA